MDRVPICKCNNCSGVFEDNNPGDVAVMAVEPFEGAYPRLIQIEDKKGEVFTGCPVCKTDVSDILDLRELWVCTDPSTGQYSRQIAENLIYEFRENNVHGVQDGEEWERREIMNIREYSREDIVRYCEPFGYGQSTVKQWLDNEENIPLILECIFELT